MNLKSKELSKIKFDLMLLKEKGVSNDKISKIVGIPIEMIEKQINHQKEYKKYSGVF